MREGSLGAWFFNQCPAATVATLKGVEWWRGQGGSGPHVSATVTLLQVGGERTSKQQERLPVGAGEDVR